jgi:hypothetical protein
MNVGLVFTVASSPHSPLPACEWGRRIGLWAVTPISPKSGHSANPELMSTRPKNRSVHRPVQQKQPGRKRNRLLTVACWHPLIGVKVPQSSGATFL